MQSLNERGVDQWMDESRQIAAQCWCDEETKHIEMDVVLAEAIARRIAVWMDTWAQSERNIDFYRGLLTDCAKSLGPLEQEVYVQDDGGTVDSPLLIKVPELVKRLASQASLVGEAKQA